MRRYQREIYSYLRRYLGDAELAEDAFQGAFLQIHLKCDQFDSGRRFRPWLYAIATNQAIDAQRRNKRHRMASLDRAGGSEDNDGHWSEKLVGDAPDPLSEASIRENGQWVRDAVDDLGDSMKQAVHLVYYQGMKYREAAEIMRGRKVAEGVTALIVPGSESVRRQAEAEGLDAVFIEAGAEWRLPGCSMCIAMNGDQGEPGELVVSTSNRNFVGRQGKGVRTVLAGPATAAASAIAGHIADPSPYLTEKREARDAA